MDVTGVTELWWRVKDGLFALYAVVMYATDGYNPSRNTKTCPMRHLSMAGAGFLVGVTGLEPAASWSRTKRSTT